MRNLYCITRTDNVGYDEFEGIVVLAETEEAAKRIHPYGYVWSDDKQEWTHANGNELPWYDSRVWPKLSALKVEQIDPATYEGDIVLSSFNAG